MRTTSFFLAMTIFACGDGSDASSAEAEAVASPQRWEGLVGRSGRLTNVELTRGATGYLSPSAGISELVPGKPANCVAFLPLSSVTDGRRTYALASASFQVRRVTVEGTTRILELGGQGDKNLPQLRCELSNAPRTSSHWLAFEAPIDAMQLALTRQCLICHSKETKMIGPTFRDVALKLADLPDNRNRLRKSIREGSIRKWGTAAMPPNPLPSDLEVDVLIDWILSQ